MPDMRDWSGTREPRVPMSGLILRSGGGAMRHTAAARRLPQVAVQAVFLARERVAKRSVSDVPSPRAMAHAPTIECCAALDIRR